MTVRDIDERTLVDEFPELNEFLKPGMTVLDVGCGVGAITLDVAKVIEPGRIIGIDIADEGVEKAKASAKKKGVSNASFEVMDAHDIKFPDNHFDLIYSYTVAHYWWNPVKVLGEFKRLVKTGGWVINAGIRDTGWSKRYPECPNIEKVHESIMKWREDRRLSYKTSGYDNKLFNDHYAGRKCMEWHSEIGIDDVQVNGSIESMWLPGKIPEGSWFYKFMSCDPNPQGPFGEAVSAGYLDQDTLNKASEEGAKWVKDSRSFYFLTTITAKWRK